MVQADAAEQLETVLYSSSMYYYYYYYYYYYQWWLYVHSTMHNGLVILISNSPQNRQWLTSCIFFFVGLQPHTFFLKHGCPMELNLIVGEG